MKVLLSVALIVLLTGCGAEEHSVRIVAELQDRNELKYEINTDEPFSGVLLVTYPSGQNKIREEYKDGLWHGKVEKWYENGQREQIYTYINGVENGLFERWDVTGNKWSSFTYERGVPKLSKKEIANALYLPFTYLGSDFLEFKDIERDAPTSDEYPDDTKYLIEALKQSVKDKKNIMEDETAQAFKEFIELVENHEFVGRKKMTEWQGLRFKPAVENRIGTDIEISEELQYLSSEKLSSKLMFEAFLNGYNNGDSSISAFDSQSYAALNSREYVLYPAHECIDTTATLLQLQPKALYEKVSSDFNYNSEVFKPAKELSDELLSKIHNSFMTFFKNLDVKNFKSMYVKNTDITGFNYIEIYVQDEATNVIFSCSIHDGKVAPQVLWTRTFIDEYLKPNAFE
ncbi:toxin-antitoxin system YwqK family antitoxin [Vibrio gallaecicus]|uniref:Toxin-antitoxin system YwqK family antitoxin n=1 Tax=Vibrio gallaecicus TaxID=552386 RepID=A0ABV4N705_9VIBR